MHLSKVGWSLFGSGLGVEVLGLATAVAGSTLYSLEAGANSSAYSPALATTIIGACLGAIGEGCWIAGVVCLGVGYGRMHNTADSYAVYHKQNPTAYWSIQTSANGLGLALHF